MIIIKTENVSRIYGKDQTELCAVKGISLQFKAGTFTAITGRSGSGKSTLLNMIGGIDEPTKGNIVMDGQSIYELNDTQRTILRRRKIGFIFQMYNLIPDLTAYQNIILPLRLDGKTIDREYMDELIETLGLHDRIGHYPSELSGGQRQRVAIARALATKPVVILADEPTGNLDNKSGEEVLTLLHLLKRRYNQTLIMVTHDLKIAEGADRIITIDDGIVAMDTEVNI